MFVISTPLLIGEATHNLQVVLRIIVNDIEADLIKAGKFNKQIAQIYIFVK